MTQTDQQHGPSQATDERDEIQWTLKSTLALILFCFVSMGIAAVVSTWDQPPEKRTWPLIFYFCFALFLILAVRFKSVKRGYERMTVWVTSFYSVMFVTLAPLAIFIWASRFVLERLPLWAQVIFLALWVPLLASAVFQIATEKKRARFMSSLQGLSLAMPIAYSFFVLMFALLFFSSAAYVASRQGLLSFVDQAGRGVNPGSLNDFFLWHFLEAVPLLKINETLLWKQPPLTYESPWVGCVLLLFKVAVILPVIAAFKWYWTRKDETAATTNDAAVITAAAPGATAPAAPATAVNTNEGVTA